MKMTKKVVPMMKDKLQRKWIQQRIKFLKVKYKVIEDFINCALKLYFLYHWDQENFVLHKMRPQKSYKSVQKHK